jgi:hypothetical protein
MTYEELYKNITDGKYDSLLAYPPYRSDKKEREKMADADKSAKQLYREDSHRLQRQFETDVLLYVKSEVGKELTDKQWQAVWHKAWEDGHSSGYNEILMAVSDLIDIIKTFVGNK